MPSSISTVFQAGSVLLVLFLTCAPLPAQEMRPPEFEKEKHHVDKEGLERLKARQGAFPGMPLRDVPGRDLLGAIEKLNAVDRALFAVAEVYYAKKEYRDAIAELENVARQTPDEYARSAAHLAAGHIHRFHLHDTDKAVEEYKQVTGDLARVAEDQIVACYMDSGRTKDAVAILESRLGKTDLPQEKAEILFRMAELYRKVQDYDMAIETYRRVPQVITYQQAMEAQRYRAPAFEKLERLIHSLREQGRFEEAEKLERQMRERTKPGKAERKEWEFKPKKHEEPIEGKQPHHGGEEK